jgi:molybdenum cofactor cytidylyltransferase
MGTPKQLLRYQGRYFLRHITETAIASGCDPIVVVLGAYANQIRPKVEELPVRVVEHPHWAEGMGSSIRVGIRTLGDRAASVQAAIVLLCDQPFTSVQLIHQLIAAYKANRQPIVASSYAGILGVPALFDRCLFPELLTLESQQGAKHLIQNYTNRTTAVPFIEGAIDIDTPKDYQELQSSLDCS